jgi:tRNA dimethylallyltransferase
MECLVAIVGPTAIGKSELALRLAQEFNAEIVNADSRQVYRHMDIGTSKPTLAERALIPHHIIDVVDPDGDFNLAVYGQLATSDIEAIQRRDKLPLLVGGSGLYVWSIVEGWRIPSVPPDPRLRRHLEIKAKEEGIYNLHRELQRVDPVAAAKIAPTNIRRVIRALEIYQISGQPSSQSWRKEAPHFPVSIIGLTMERGELYHNIDQRVDRMVAEGLVEEVKWLLESGYSLSLPSMSGIGYRQIGDFLQGKMSLPGAIDRIKYETHRLARHQYAWFRLNDARIDWLNASHPAGILGEAKNLIESFIASGARQSHEIL